MCRNFLGNYSRCSKNNYGSFKLVQSDLDDLYVLDMAYVSDSTTTDSLVEADQAISIAESAMNDDTDILNQIPHTIVTHHTRHHTPLSSPLMTMT